MQNVESAPSVDAPKAAETKSKAGIIAASIVALAVAAAGGWYLLKPAGDIAQFDEGVTGYTADAVNLVQFAENSPKALKMQENGDTFVRVTGSSYLFAIQPTAVDPTRQYRVKARVRVVQEDPTAGGALTYAGVATYDANGALQKDAPGAHRYGAALSRNLTVADGWVDLEGVMTGEGNDNHQQFRVGTKTVRPVVTLNYQSNTAVTDITTLTIEEIKP